MTFDEWDNKPSQDTLDGRALHRLREALPEGAQLRLEGPLTEYESNKPWWVTFMDPARKDIEPDYAGATIAEAADKCREALG